jgi:glutamyl-tRNA synthetase
LVAEGNAYVDDSPVDIMRKNRWDGIASAARTQSVEENTKLWQDMKEGTEHGQKCVLRAKIDMSNPNKALRDPTIYRYVDSHHHKTG